MTDLELSLATATPATDLLESHGFDEAAELLRQAPELVAKADRLERIIEAMEKRIRPAVEMGLDPGLLACNPDVIFIAEHREETPEATLARLRPAEPRTTVAFTPSGQGAIFAFYNPLPSVHRYESPTRGPFSVPLDSPDLTEAIGRAVRREREHIEEFIREVGATLETHRHMTWPLPSDTYAIPDRYDDHFGRSISYYNTDKIHVLVPLADVPPAEQLWPTREEACRRWPWRRIGRESVVRGGDR